MMPYIDWQGTGRKSTETVELHKVEVIAASVILDPLPKYCLEEEQPGKAVFEIILPFTSRSKNISSQ